MSGKRATFRDVLAVREFRALWLADAQSLVGDQLARVALSVLVYQRTGSASTTALVYALTFAPAILGGVMLGFLADRLPRRGLMVGCDLMRAVLVAVMALPGLPLPALFALVVLVVLLGRPFAAAQSAVVPDLLAGDRYVVGSGLRTMTNQAGQVVGFAVGGVAVAAIGARHALLVDAATFAVSALILRVSLADRRTPVREIPESGRARSSAVAVAGLVAHDPRLRVLVGLGWLAAFHVVPEGIAAPYAAAVGGGEAAVGVLMASMPAGAALGVLVLVRLPRQWRERLMGPLAVATALPLIACAAKPGLAWSVVLWGLVGFCSAYQIVAATSFVRLLPDGQRGQMISLVSSGLVALQGVGVYAFGALAVRVDVRIAVAWAGVAAATLALPLAAAWARQMTDEPSRRRQITDAARAEPETQSL